MALTGDAAREAHAHAGALQKQLAIAQALIGNALQAELAALRQVLWVVGLGLARIEHFRLLRTCSLEMQLLNTAIHEQFTAPSFRLTMSGAVCIRAIVPHPQRLPR